MFQTTQTHRTTSSAFPLLTAALATVGLISTARAQVQVAGELLVQVNATALPFGPLNAITNTGTMGGVFEARGGAVATPVIGQPNTNATRGIVFDGGDFLQHAASPGGALLNSPDTIVGENPSSSIEAWVLNPDIPDEETIVAWGFRGGPDGSNMSFNYGANGAWGAVGHWGAPDLGWFNGGGAPAANVWHHLVYTYDGTTQRVYSDGVELNSEAVALSIHAGTPILIGAQYDNGAGAVTGGLRASHTLGRLRIHAEALSAAQISNNYAVEKNEFNLGRAIFLTQPQNVSTQETRTASFSVTLQGEPPIALQWYKNNSAVSGANGTTMVQTNLMVSDSGSQFYAVASNFSGGSSFVATSSVATLTVVGDTAPPTVLQARANSSTQIELVFSEAIRPSDATNAANYTLSGPGGLSVTGAALGNDASRVVLTVNAPLLECESYRVAVSGVRDASPSGNVIAAGTSISFFNYGLTGLARRYTFNLPPNPNATGASVPDSLGGAPGVVRNGSGTTTFTGDRVTLSGGDDLVAPYIDLPNGIVSANSTNLGGTGKLTLEGWVRITGTFNWSRIFDIGSTDIGGGVGGEVTGPGGPNNNGAGLDYLMLSASIGTDNNNRRLEFRNEDPAGGGISTVDHATTSFNQMTHFVVTWDEATGQITTYENGNQVSTTFTDDPMSAINDVNVWLGRSNWRGDDNIRGEYDEFRVYSNVLSLAEVRLNNGGGPDNSFGALTSLRIVPSTNVFYTNNVGTVRVLAGFSNGSTQNLALSPCAIYSSSDSNIVYITPDGVLRTVNEGTATVRVVLGGLTNSTQISVIIDSIPPTLVSANARGPREIEVVFSEPLSVGTASEASNFAVSSPGAPPGTINVVSVTQLSDQSRVVLQLDGSLPCEFITVTVSDLEDQSPLRNKIIAGSEIGFFNYIPSGLVHRYTFNNVAGSAAPTTVIPDAMGTANGTLIGSGASFTGQRLILPGGSSASAPYVDLPNGLLSTNSTNNGGSGQVTFEGWVKVTGNRAWSRIFDFGSTGPCCGMGGEITGTGGGGEGIDYFFYSAQNGGDINTRRVDVTNRDQADHGTVGRDFAITNFNQEIHFVVSWNEATGLITVHENGVQRTNMYTVAAMNEINDVNVWLGRSTWTGDANLQGEYNEFRIYDRILGTNEIAFNRAIGPDNILGQPTAFRLEGTNHVQFGRSIPVRALVDFTTRSNVDLTASGCVVFQSSDSSVVTNDSAGLRALNLGSATVTASFNGMSTSIVFTVGYQMQFRGLSAGSSYNLQVASQVTGPWTTIASRTAGPGGVIDFEDVIPRGSQAFFRAVPVSPP